jgi:hypothetical protein
MGGKHRLRIWVPVTCTMVITAVLISACDGPGRDQPESGNILARSPEIFPDYCGVAIPDNIAPLNFRIMEEGEHFRVILAGEKGTVIRLKAKGKTVRIPSRRWKRFLSQNSGQDFEILVSEKVSGDWQDFTPIVNRIAPFPVDPVVVYRLIPPGYETWSSMGLYQRNLSTFRERALIENRYAEENCVNCHAFAAGNPDFMMFHVRGSIGGTMIRKGDHIQKVNLKNEEALSAGVYPSWHPSGEYIALSTNKIEQYFHARTDKIIEVLDRHSDLILYKTASGEITHVPGTQGDEYMETYPAWSPDGRYLYFSRSEASADTPYDSIRYDICRIAFDPENNSFGNTEMVFEASAHDHSASMPRVSPDGRHLLCTVHNYGTFPIWHKEADLCQVDLDSMTWSIPEPVNSDDTDSYHSWSANSRWVMFSSRRLDGRYTRLYISYVDEQGTFHKPFLLPQRDPDSNQRLFYSYNVPELVTGNIDVNPRRLVSILRMPVR